MERQNEGPEMMLRPVGVVRNEITEPSLVAGSGGLEWRPHKGLPKKEDRRAEVVVSEQYAACLDGIEGYSHLLVLWWAHRVHPERRALRKVHPRGDRDLPLMGIFGTCSPARPNPVCTTVVRLVERRGTVLHVQGLDAVNGSPVVDIKPYNPHYYQARDARVPEWMARFRRGQGSGSGGR